VETTRLRLVSGVAALAVFAGIARGQLSLEQALALSLAVVALVWAITTRTTLLVGAFIGACWFLAAFPGRDQAPIEPAAAVGLLFLCRLGLRRDTPHERRGLIMASEVLLVGLVVSVAVSITKSGGIIEGLPWLVGPLVAAALLRIDIRHLPSRDALLGVVAAAVSVTLATDLVNLVRADASSTRYFDLGRYMGSVNDYELAGEYYAVAGLLSLSTLLLADKRLLKIVAIPNLAASTFLVFATQTRGALLLLTLGAGSLLLIAFWGKRTRARVVVVASAVSVAVATQSDRIVTSDAVQRLLSVNFDSGLATSVNRAQVWQDFLAQPTFRSAGLFGNGLDYQYELLRTYPHSLYIWSIWSIGWIGTLILCLALASLLALLASRRASAQQASRMMFVILALQLIDQAKIEVARTDATVMYMWGLIAVAVALYRIDGPQEPKLEPRPVLISRAHSTA